MNNRVRALVGAWERSSRRAAIFEYPIREMQARGWIAQTDDTEQLESELLRFFGGWPEVPPLTQPTAPSRNRDGFRVPSTSE